MKYLNKLVIVIVLMFTTVCIKAQDDFDIKLSETEINKTLDAIIAARGLNFGEHYDPVVGINYWIANVNAAHIDIQPNNQIKLVIEDIYFLTEIDLTLVEFTVTEHFSGNINAEFVLEGNETDGYNIVLKSNSVNLSSWGDLGGLPGYISELFINDDIIAYIPDINLSLTDITPDFFTEAFNLGTPPISSDNESVYLNFNTIGDRFINVANKLLIPNSTPVTNEGDVYHLENSSFVPYKSGFEFAWDLNSNHTVKPEDSGIDYDGDNNNHYKYDKWEDNDTKPVIRSLTVSKDDWYNALFSKSYNVNFSANYEGSAGNFGNININGNNYTFPKSKYIFSSPLSEPVSVSSDFTYSNNNYVFLNWSDGSTATTRNISPSSPLSLTANYKGTQLSNYSSTHANNSQRKIVSTINGDLHSVYESMGRIWLERSTDNGQTWTIMNNGRSLNDEDEAKNPSMAIVGDNRFVVVYQENIGGYNTITMKVVALEPTVTVSNLIEVYSDENLYNYDANPVVTVEHCSSNQYYYYLIVWDENTGIYQPKGLYYKIMQEDLNSVFTEINEDPTIITNTDNNSLNPTVTSSFISKSNPEFHVAWEQQSTAIKYSKIYLAHRNNEIDITDYSEPSAGRYAINYSPSIAITLNRPRVSWLTRHPVTLISEAVVRTYGSYWGGIRAYTYSGGDNVESVSINNRNIAYGLVMAYGGDGREIRYTKGFTTTYAASPTQNNKDVQVSNGDDFTDMFISSLKTTSSPYLFEFNQIDESLNKSSSANSSVGRSANITSNN